MLASAATTLEPPVPPPPRDSSSPANDLAPAPIIDHGDPNIEEPSSSSPASDLEPAHIVEPMETLEAAPAQDLHEGRHDVHHDVHHEDLHATSSSLPWWVFVLFGVVAVAIAVAVFAYTSRCPCDKAKQHLGTAHDTAPGTAHMSAPLPTGVPPGDAKPFVEPPLTDLKSTVYVLSWQGSIEPSEVLGVHFLLTTEPFSTYSCTARDLFGSHGRVRVTLPKGTYAVRAVFDPEGTQQVSEAAKDGGLVILTESSLECRVLREHVAAVDVLEGTCRKDS